MLYPECAERTHWKSEVYNILHRVPRFANRKWPRSSFIFDALSSWDDVADNLAISVMDQEDTLNPIDVKTVNIEYMLYEYHKWAVQQLAKDGVLRRQDVYNKIEELL